MPYASRDLNAQLQIRVEETLGLETLEFKRGY